MKKIVDNWIDIARTTWKLPNGKIIELAEEILITKENDTVTINIIDGFDPYDTSKGTPKPSAKLVLWADKYFFKIYIVH